MLTSVDANESLFESVLIFNDVLAFDDLLASLLSVELGFRTAPTLSFAKRDHDSILLCANQHAAGPKPLIFVWLSVFFCLSFFLLFLLLRLLALFVNQIPASLFIQWHFVIEVSLLN